MNYELAKKLKEAGYPMKLAITTSDPSNLFTYPVGGAHFYIYPTLSELIEACGDRFACLLNLGNDDWKARADEPCYECYNGQPEGKGSTPEEAVANLWLELNKKESDAFDKMCKIRYPHDSPDYPCPKCHPETNSCPTCGADLPPGHPLKT